MSNILFEFNRIDATTYTQPAAVFYNADGKEYSTAVSNLQMLQQITRWAFPRQREQYNRAKNAFKDAQLG